MKKLKLLIAACALIVGAGQAWAQTDVTSMYLTNAGFDDGETGWTFNGSGTTYHGVAAYGSSTTINSATNINVDKFGKNLGNAAFSNAGWGDKSYYTQEVTLPAGSYKLTFDVINRFADKTGINANYFGWVPNSGDAVYSTTKTFEYNVWYTLSVTFTLAESTTGKISCGMQSTSGKGSGEVAKLFIDNVKIIKTDEASTPTTAKPIDYSDLINQTTWSVQQDDNAIPTTSSTLVTNITSGDWTGRYVERYRGVAGHFGKALFQTISVPAGVYQVQAACMSSSANGVDAAAGKTDGDKDVAYFYANSEELTYPLSDKKGYYHKHIVTLDADGTIEFGINTKVVGANWNAIGCATLIKVANSYDDYIADLLSTQIADFAAIKATAAALLENSEYDNVVGAERTELTTQSTATVSESTVAAYETAIAAVQNAIDAFTDAKKNYDALVAEIAKAKALGITAATADDYAATSESTAATALTSTQNLKVAEYNYVNTNYSYGVSLGEWTTSGDATADNKGQHWDGTGTSTYKEQKNNSGSPKQGWDASAWTIGFSQDVTLPAGNYVFKVAGRKASGNNSTLSLVVKNGETTIGTVNDFPEGDIGKGIDISGATNFGDGTYANSNNGRGWEWRYVKFTLEADATVNIAVNANAVAEHQWISFCNYTVQTDNEANVALITYNIALSTAQTTLANTDYSNVTGSEKTALENAIAADATLDKTSKTAIEAATTALDNAVAAFTAAKASYDAFVAAKSVEYTDNLPYASSTKFAAIATAQAETATTAADAGNKTTAIISAYRKYVESNALAEGVTGAENKTNLISDPNMDVTYDGTAHTFGAWQVFGQVDGNIQLLSGESFTDGDGKNDYKYADIWKSDNNAGIQQTISDLPAGKYLLTVTARANTTSGAAFWVFAGNKTANIQRIGNSGGVFDRGWNDTSVEFYVYETSDVNIGVQSGNGKDLWWSATRFRLVKLEDIATETIDEDVTFSTDADVSNVNATLSRTFSATNWNTFVVPFDIDNTTLKSKFGTDVEVAEYSETVDGESSTLNFNKMTTPAITANTPVLLKTTTTGDVTFTGVTIKAGEANVAGTNFDFVGTYAAKTFVKTGDYYFYQNNIYKSAADGGTFVKGTRAYIHAKSAEARIARFFIDGVETTGIDGIEAAGVNNGKVYNLNGQRVEKAQKGLYIQNGKKVVIK